MKKILVAGIAVAAYCGAPVFAADMPVKAPSMAAAPVFSWTGWYVGANGGYAWQDPSHVDLFTAAFGPGVALTTPGFKAEGGFGGGQIGYNLQNGHIVYGFETDFQGANIKNKFSIPSGGGPFFIAGNTFAGHSNLDWFGTVRGRLGYASDNALLYVTGGFAYGGIDERVQAIPPIGNIFYDINRKGTLTGFVVGGGLEWALSPSWSLKGEYQFIDLGSDRLTGTNVFASANSNEVNHHYQTVRLGLNYKFGSR